MNTRNDLQIGTTAITITRAATPRDHDAVKALFVEYAESLGFSLCFQGFEAELAAFPGKYAPPGGALLLARVEEHAAGAVGLRPFAPGVCEMKRLYVRPAYRVLRTEEKLSIGRRLAHAIAAEARALGYERLWLDTVPGKMDAAIRLYREMGFVEIPAYYASPITDAMYLELRL